MQKVKMLKTLHGVLAGEVYPRVFEQGKEYEINDSLVLGFMEQGGCELVSAEGPEKRETKVTGPDETKPLDLNTLKQPELLSIAKQHGLELKANTSKKDIIAAIEAAQTLAGADTAA